LIGDPTQPTALSPETRDVSSVLRTERQIEGSEHEQRLAALRKKREGLERAFRIEIELGNKITRDAYNLSSQPMADPDERQYLMESMDKIKQEMAKLVREIKETDAEIAREQQPPTPPEEQRTPEPRRLDSLSPSENSGPLSSGTPPPAPPADTPRPW
jgi:chromosome segregation ATPase